MTTPLATIGIPTFNRADRLPRAARSALSQTCADIEVVISDNGSSDETEAVARALADGDPRVRYIRQPINIGPVGNFNFVRDQARGRFFMWLSDDDWLDADYVARCVDVLQDDAGCALAAGLPSYYHDAQFVRHDIPLNLASRSRLARMLRHYYLVVDCGSFYGLMRREHARLITLRKVVGCDWLAVGALAFMGRVRTIPDIHIHRQLTGVSRSYARNARAVSGSTFQARHPHLSTALASVADVLSSPAYRPLGPVRRAALALATLMTIYVPRTAPAKWLLRARRRLMRSITRARAGRRAARAGNPTLE